MTPTTTKNGKQIALITGANAGLGKEIARQFAAGGEFSKVYLACRNKDKAAAAKKELAYRIRASHWEEGFRNHHHGRF